MLPDWGGGALPPCRYLPLGVLPAGKPALPNAHGGSPSLQGFQIPCCSNPRFMKSGFLCVGSGIHASPKFLGSSAESQGDSPPWGVSWSRLGAVCSPRPACHRSGQPQRRHHPEETGGQEPEAAICLDISQENGGTANFTQRQAPSFEKSSI